MSDRDFVVLPRDALLELFGELALPPWIDVDGSVLGGRISCDPIAQRITKWIAEHDLSDVHIGAPAAGQAEIERLRQTVRDLCGALDYPASITERFVTGEAVAGSATPTGDDDE